MSEPEIITPPLEAQPAQYTKEGRVANRIASQALNAYSEGLLSFRVRGGKYGLRDTQHSIRTYRFVASILKQEGLEINVSRHQRRDSLEWTTPLGTWVPLPHRFHLLRIVTVEGQPTEVANSGTHQIDDQVYPPVPQSILAPASEYPKYM